MNVPNTNHLRREINENMVLLYMSNVSWKGNLSFLDEVFSSGKRFPTKHKLWRSVMQFVGNRTDSSTEGEKMKLGCWKIFECNSCYDRKVSYAKVKSCTTCRTARQKRMMNVISYLFWWVVLACLTKIARAILCPYARTEFARHWGVADRVVENPIILIIGEAHDN